MKNISPESIPPVVRAWFGQQIEHLAMRHDLAGPQISRVHRGNYMKELIREFHNRAVAARQTGELATSAEELNIFCKRAARELIAIRQIRADYRSGKLPTERLRQLPAYTAFQAYLDETPALVLAELMAAARELEEQKGEDVDSSSLAQPGQPSDPVAPETRAWMGVHALGLALADDIEGPPFGSVQRDAYITGAAVRVRESIRRAIAIGDINVPSEDVDKIAWVVACEAYLLRSLKAARQAGELTEENLKGMPIYTTYKDYFERGSDLASVAMSIAATVGQPIQTPGAQN